MKLNPISALLRKVASLSAFASLVALVTPTSAVAQADPNAAPAPTGLRVAVYDDAGAPVPGFRWLLEVDNTDLTTPGTPQNDSVSLVVHKSYAPVVASGEEVFNPIAGNAGSQWVELHMPPVTLPVIVPSSTTLALPPTLPTLTPQSIPPGRYVLSAMADGYSVGGISVTVEQGKIAYAKIKLNNHAVRALPTVQISVLVFHDKAPVNNEPDDGEEGLGGFRIQVLDPIIGGPVRQDAFGNQLGTEYDPATGEILKMGDGFIYTDKDGKALVKNLWMGKFGIQVVPPTGENWTGGHASVKGGGNWHQTATIEGTQTVDTWASPNNPRIFIEGFGTGFYHAFFGMVDPDKLPGLPTPNASPNNANAAVTVKGKIRYNHYGTPPLTLAVAPGSPVPNAWFAINEVAGGAGLYAAAANPDTGEFTINGVRGGTTFEFVSWDTALDAIWNTTYLKVPPRPNAAQLTSFGTASANGVQITTSGNTRTFVFSDQATGNGANYRGLTMVASVNGNTVTTVTSATYQMPDVLVIGWFGSFRGSVFYDHNGNGFPDQGDEGLRQQVVNLRYRNGSIYMSTITDNDGNYNFAEVFPFFKWLIAEVDFTRFKPTGLTAVVDKGGFIPGAKPDGSFFEPKDGNSFWQMPSEGFRAPQGQYELKADGTADITKPILNLQMPAAIRNNLSRTDTNSTPEAPLLLQAMQLYLGQDNRVDWGKTAYKKGENGGIAGIISYNNTRAEADPRNGTMELWDAGIPRVQVSLYEYEPNFATLAAQYGSKTLVNGQPADINRWKMKRQGNLAGPAAGRAPRTSDVDNYPFGWMNDPTQRGPEDIDLDDLDHSKYLDRDEVNPTKTAGYHAFNPGDAVNIVHSDSFDDDVLANAVDGIHGFPAGTVQENAPTVMGRKIVGSDNLATWNQVRTGVFDGGYLFGGYYPGGMAKYPPTADGDRPGAVTYLHPGNYVVQVQPPPGYLIQTEEARNVFFGDAYVPSALLLPPECIGDFHWVPAFQNLFPDQAIPADYANQWRPLADRKLLSVKDGINAGADFHLYTEVPKAARLVGFTLNDLSAEFDPSNPSYNEKEAPGIIPVSIRDWLGHEVGRCYADEYGSYNALLPSTYNAAVPDPSGFAPQMLTLILNDPTMPADPADPDGVRIPDPNYNPNFTTTPWTLHYYPGGFLYADTPILPTAAFVGSPNGTLDVEPPTGTPVIYSIAGTTAGVAGCPTCASVDPTLAGSYVRNSTDVVTLTSRGTVHVMDPDYHLYGSANTVERDFGFGAAGTGSTVKLIDELGASYDLSTLSGSDIHWSNSTITFKLPISIANGVAKQLQLLVVRAGGKTSPIGVTLQYEPDASKVHFVPPVDYTFTPPGGLPPTPIQDAIDASAPGDLVVVPISPYDWNENPIIDRPIRMQGAGFGTVLRANPTPDTRMQMWHDKIAALMGDGNNPFSANECPGFMVFGLDDGFYTYTLDQNGTVVPKAPFAAPRIDGFQIVGALQGGGISVFNGTANLHISNNRIFGNRNNGGGGGISIGMESTLGVTYNNTNLVIEFNEVVKNSAVNGGGGIAIYTGATHYRVENNYVMGNFATADPGGNNGIVGGGAGGGGIAHVGLSPGGMILNNVVAFNECFWGYSAGGGDGAGIFVGGEQDGPTRTTSANGVVTQTPTLTSGSGSVTIMNNLIQGNLAGAGFGGGIRLAGVNGDDYDTANFADGVNFNNGRDRYHVNIFNNIIVDNVAGFAGGGISMIDTAFAYIDNNTIANNISTATAHAAFSGNAMVSTPTPAGIANEPSSAAFTQVGGPRFSLPASFKNNIIYNNLAYHFDFRRLTLPNGNPGGIGSSIPGTGWGGTGNEPTNNALAGLVLDGPKDVGTVNSTDTGLLTAAYFPGAAAIPAVPPTPAGPGGVPPARPGRPAVPAVPPNQNYLTFATASSTTPQPVPPFGVTYQDSLYIAVVPDEAGNNIAVRFDPIGLYYPSGKKHDGTVLGGTAGNPRGNYHFATIPASGSPLASGVNLTTRNIMNQPSTLLQTDIDGDARPTGATPWQVGADHRPSSATAGSLAGIIPPVKSAALLALSDRYTAQLLDLTATPPLTISDGPLIAPTAPIIPPPLNPVWNTNTASATDLWLFSTNDMLSLGSLGLRLQAQSSTANHNFSDSTRADVVAYMLWGGVIPTTNTPPPANPNNVLNTNLRLSSQTKQILDGTYQGTEDPALLSLMVGSRSATDLATAFDNSKSSNVRSAAMRRYLGDLNYTIGFRLSPAAGHPIVVGPLTTGDTTPVQNLYTLVFNNAFLSPSAQTTTLLGQYNGASPAAQPELLTRLNRSVLQDAFTELRRVYDDNIAYKHLAAGDGFAIMANGIEVYTFGFSDHTADRNDVLWHNALLDANIAGPTMTVREGQTFHLDLSNVSMKMRPDLFDPHTVHFHGFPQAAPIFDGMPMASIGVREGATQRYYYLLNDPGTYFYHCHVEATEHMQQGMIGNLWVYPKQDRTNVGTSFPKLPYRDVANSQQIGSGKHQSGFHYAYNDLDGSTYYDKELPLQMTGFDHHFHDEELAIQPPDFFHLFDDMPLLNGRGYPDTVKSSMPVPQSVIDSLDPQETPTSAGFAVPGSKQRVASTFFGSDLPKVGDYILLRISNVSETDFNTLTVLGLPMRVVGKDARLLRGPSTASNPIGQDLSYNTTSVTLGGGESIDVILDTRTAEAGKKYFIYATRFTQLSNDHEDYGGIMTHIEFAP